MINLLPPDMKKSYKYARLNVRLRNWVIAGLIACIGLAALATYGLVSLHQSTRGYQNQIAGDQQLLQKENYSAAQKQIQDISSSFKLAYKVLSNEVLFSQLLKQVAADIPNNANLTGLQIQQVSGAIEISADAVDYQTASQVQVNLSNAGNKIFSKADIESINCNNTSAGQYPCTVTVRALFASNNPFLFISNSKEAKQ